jgi:predicted Zn-dependent protease
MSTTSPAPVPAPAPARRVLSHDEALSYGRTLLDMVGDETRGVTIEHVARAITHVANGVVRNIEDGDDIRITFRSAFGGDLPVTFETNALQPSTLQAVVQRARAMAPPKRPPTIDMPVDYSDLDPFTYNQRTFPPVALWHDSSVRAMEGARSEVLPHLLGTVRDARLNGAATIGMITRSVLHVYKLGLTAFAEETDCEMTVTARTPDRTGSGWGGRAHRAWNRVAVNDAITDAIEFANRSRGPVALEPGRRTAILGPAAVAQLVRRMAYSFSFNWTQEGYTPLSFDNRAKTGRRTKMGMRVVDPRIMLTSDPADPEGGFAPFFELDSDVENTLYGFPTAAATWIDRGILTRLTCNANASVGRRLTPCELPTSVRLAPVPGTQTATIQEMIAACKDGIYVHRFTEPALAHMPSGMMTGVTRDGCFHIKNGAIAKPIKNFRFLESPLMAFNRLEMIGVPERVAFGLVQSPDPRRRARWPRLPVIVPPMMIRDFNFNALSDAV